MPLIISPMVEDDIPIIVAIEHAAVVQSPLNPLTVVRKKLANIPTGENSDEEYLKSIEAIVLAGYRRRAQENTYFYKLIDTDIPADSDKHRGIVSFLVWRIVTGSGRDEVRGTQDNGHDACREDAPEMRSVAAANHDEKKSDDQSVSAFSGTAVGRELNRLAARFRQEHFPNEPYQVFEVGMTLPAYWRRGALSMLLEHALQVADERGIISVMQASEMGWPLYHSLGFEVVKETALDLKPFGLDASVPHRDMIRRPGRGVRRRIRAKL